MQALLFANHQEESTALTVLFQQAGFLVQTVKKLTASVESWPELDLYLSKKVM